MLKKESSFIDPEEFYNRTKNIDSSENQDFVDAGEEDIEDLMEIPDDFESKAKQTYLKYKNSKEHIQISAKMAKPCQLKNFVIVDWNEYEKTEKFLTENEWLKILNHKNH